MIKVTNLIQTGIAWIPEIPSDWELKRIKLLFDFNKNIVGKTSADYDVLSLTTKGVIKRDIESGKGKFPASFDGYQIVKPNSIMLCLFDMDVTPRVVGHVDDDGIISAAYTNIIPKKDINAKYYYYYFLLQDKNKSLLALGTGIRITLNKDFFGTLKIPYPPITVQNSIVAYLDKKNNEIEKFIRNKERLIELLEEEKQSEIDKCISTGLDENVKLKATFLGFIPEHWENRRLGTIGRFIKGGNISRDELTTSFASDDDVSAILYGDIYTKYNIVAENIINKISQKTASKSVRLLKGDLLFTGSGETKEDIGKCVLFNSSDETYAGGDVIIFKQNKIDSHFISYSQNSSLAKYQKHNSSKGEIIIHTYGSKLKDVFMPFPPSFEEQREIVNYINEESRLIDLAISKAQQEISSIKEYREALITDLVTGKRSVPQ